MTKMTNFNTSNGKMVLARVQAALSDLNEDLGVELVVKQNFKYGESGFKFTLEAQPKDMKIEDTKAGRSFKLHHAHYGVSEKALDSTFYNRGALFRVLGIKPSRPMYPFVCERVNDGIGFKFGARTIAAEFPLETRD